MNKFGQNRYVTGSGRTLTIYKDEIVRQFSLLQFTPTELYDGVLTWKTCC